MAQQQFVDVSQVLAMFSDAKGLINVNTETALSKAGDATAARIKGKVPVRWQKSVQSKVWRSSRYRSGLTFGIFRGHHEGHQNKNYSRPMDDWQKGYWLNYGTYSNRDKTHTFRSPRKNGTKDIEGGVKPEKFFERAKRGWQKIFLEEFTKIFNAQEL